MNTIVIATSINNTYLIEKLQAAVPTDFPLVRVEDKGFDHFAELTPYIVPLTNLVILVLKEYFAHRNSRSNKPEALETPAGPKGEVTLTIDGVRIDASELDPQELEALLKRLQEKATRAQ